MSNDVLDTEPAIRPSAAVPRPAPRGWLERSYDWIVSYASKPEAVWVLAIVSFIESSISPITPLPLLIPMCLARPERAFWYAAVCAASSVAGGFLGYAIGALLYESVGQWLIAIYGLADKAAAVRASAHDSWVWFAVLITKGVTPIPFKLVTIVSGLVTYNLVLFTLASVIARFSFFFLMVVALRFYGTEIRNFIETRMKLAALILVAFLVGGFFIVPHLL